MKSIPDLLADHPFTAGLAPEQIALLAGCASNAQFDEGAVLFRAGAAADRFYIVRVGQIAIENHEPGRGRLTVETVGEGDVVGWSWLVPPHRWLFDGRAVTAVRAVALDGACLRKKCDDNHDLGYALLQRVAAVVGERLSGARLQLLDLYGRRAEEDA